MDKPVASIPCVILAGGFGTRLQSVVNHVVKPMAPMGHKPFLHILMDHLHGQGLQHFVLALGHKAASVTEYFEALQLPYSISYSIEKEPLGTGGALRQAIENLESEIILALNGDTFFDVPIPKFVEDAAQSTTSFFMALKAASNAERYGNVVLKSGVVESLQASELGEHLQNAGVYCFKKSAFLVHTSPGKSALESDIFVNFLRDKQLGGKPYEGFFIDIGVPDDYHRAQGHFGKYFIDKSWTLFLDRDGVINERLIGDYIKTVDEFHFIPGVLEAIAQFSLWFGRIVVVTNQQGISKGLMTERNLDEIHRYMRSEIERQGGRIDAVYFAPQLAAEKSEMRKPRPGMGHQAQADFPDIDFGKSVMIGDSDSDIVFGQTLGMITVKLDNPDASSSIPDQSRLDLASCIHLFENLKMR